MRALKIAESLLKRHNEVTNNVYGEGRLIDMAEYVGDYVESIIPLNFYSKDVESLSNEDLNFLFVLAIQEDLLRIRRDKLVFGEVALDDAGLTLVTGGLNPDENLHFDCLVRYYIRSMNATENTGNSE